MGQLLFVINNDVSTLYLGGDECIWPHEVVTDFKIGHDLMRADYQHTKILKKPGRKAS